MAWRPKFSWPGRGVRADATTADNELDDVESIDEDTEETQEDTAEETSEPDATSAADLRAENERLRAENQKLSARAGETTLKGAQTGALKSAVRLFGQGTPKLKDAKALVALASTPDEADAFRAAWDLAFGATSLAGRGGVRQTTTTVTPAADADPEARGRSVAARTRPRGMKGN